MMPRLMMLLLLSVLLCLSLPLLLSHVVFAAYEHNGTKDDPMIEGIPLPAMWNQTTQSSAGTIYVGLTVTDEESCERTLTSLISNAKRPELLRVAVVVVNSKGDQASSSRRCAETGQALLGQDGESQNKIEVIHLNSNLFPPIVASTIVSRYYKGEDFALTVAETNGLSFTRHWDVDLIDQHARTRNDRAVLTTYLTRKDGVEGTDALAILCKVVNNKNEKRTAVARHNAWRPASQPIRTPVIRAEPQLQPLWSHSFSFSRGHFVTRVPAERDNGPEWIEECHTTIRRTMRGFHQGYDFYTPEHPVIFGDYGSKSSPSYLTFGGKLTRKPWGPLNDEDGVRPVEILEKLLAVDGICSRVLSGEWHREFTMLLREDEQGINYDMLKTQ